MLARDVDGPGNASGHLRFEREQRHRVAGDSIVAPIGELGFAGCGIPTTTNGSVSTCFYSQNTTARPMTVGRATGANLNMKRRSRSTQDASRCVGIDQHVRGQMPQPPRDLVDRMAARRRQAKADDAGDLQTASGPSPADGEGVSQSMAACRVYDRCRCGDSSVG